MSPSSAPTRANQAKTVDSGTIAQARIQLNWRAPLAWIVCYLVLLDVAVNILFAYPADPRNVSPSKISQYFEYGRSVEGKLARQTRRSIEASAPILSAGWLEDLPAEAQDGGKIVVTIYGMSHAGLLANALSEIDHDLTVRYLGAPAATPAWSFSAYLRDRLRRRSDVVVLSVMTSAIPLLGTTSGATMYFDGAYPYTYPRYVVEHDTLTAIEPPFLSLEGYRSYFYDNAKWEQYVAWLAKNDKYYDPLLFRGGILDRSALVRLARRSYAISSRASKDANVYDPVRGFNLDSAEVKIIQAMAVQFAKQARLDGAIPAVYIVNSLNTGDSAFRLLEPVLTRERALCLSSHRFVPPNDPAYYLPNSHFIPSKDRELAQSMSNLIHAQLARK